MKRIVLNAAMQELRAALNEAETLSAHAEVNKRDEARINVLLAKIAQLGKGSVAPNDFLKRWFQALVTGQPLPPDPTVEQRGDLLAGTQSITYTQGPEGGFLVPNEFHNELVLGMAQIDPLLDEDVVTLISGKGLRPYSVPGWDLSTFAATKRAEGAQQATATVPTAATTILGGKHQYRAELGADFEIEQDSFMDLYELMMIAYQIGFARGIGADLAVGNGTTAPQGVATGAASSGYTTASAGVISLTDILAIYFALDRGYRAMPKCAWLMNDKVYSFVRAAKDSNNRPLLDVIKDKEVLMGKPIYICPSLSSNSGDRGIIFGDLSRYFVRVTQMALQRSINAAGYAENGKALYRGFMRANAKIVDATAGTKPPIIYATLA